jgi:hypothetical protein
MRKVSAFRVFSGAALILGLSLGSIACGPVDVDAPVNADTDVDNERNTTININEIRQLKIVELESPQKEAVCNAITEETEVSCRKSNGETFSFTYSRSGCADDLDAVSGSCEATVDDYLACEAIDACSRHTNPKCERLLRCGEQLKIFVDVNVRTEIQTGS